MGQWNYRAIPGVGNVLVKVIEVLWISDIADPILRIDRPVDDGTETMLSLEIVNQRIVHRTIRRSKNLGLDAKNPDKGIIEAVDLFVNVGIAEGLEILVRPCVMSN